MARMFRTQPYLSVVVPSYNEERNIARGVLPELTTFLNQQTYTWEIIFTDDGSTDQTVPMLHDFIASLPDRQAQRCRVLENQHAGKGPTVMAGLMAAEGEWRLFTDFDQSTPLSEVKKLLTFTDHDYEVIIGSREGEGAKREAEPGYRHLMGRVFNFAVQVMAVPGIRDTQCGFKLLSARAVKILLPALQVYGRNKGRMKDAFTGAFDVEILYLAKKYGFRIKEVPILWKHSATNRVSALKDSVRMFRDILRIRLTDFRGKYPAKIALNES